MRKIEIYYNPYLVNTRLVTDGEERSKKGRRVNEFIVGQSIENWLSPYVFSYHKWGGVLPELMEDLNDDELDLWFYSLPKYFQRFSEELERQREAIVERGYSADFWQCTCVEKFEPKIIQEQLIKFVAAKTKSAPDQYSIQLFDYAANYLRKFPPYVENLREIYKNLNEALDTAEKNSHPRHARYWQISKAELLDIFDGRN